MPRLIRLPLALVVALGGPASADPHPSPDVPRPFITLRLDSSSPGDALSSKLVELSEPVTVTVPARTPPENAMHAFCGGSYTNTWLKAVQDLNGPLAERPYVQTLRLPACALFKRIPPKTTLQPGETFDDVLHRVLPVTQQRGAMLCLPGPGECQLVPALRAVSAINGGKRTQLDALRPGQQVQLPASPEWTTVFLKRGIDPAVAVADVLKAARQDGLPVSANPPAHLALVAPLSADDRYVKGTPCDPEAGVPPPGFPWDEERLRSAVAYLMQRRPKPKQTVIRVADTGFRGMGHPDAFPCRLLAVNLDSLDPYDTGCGSGTFGWGLTPESHEIRPPLDAPAGDHPEHGTEVADLALGPAFLRDDPRLAEFIQLDVARVFHGATPIDGDILVSLSNHPPEAAVVNLSVGGPSEVNGLGQALRTAQLGDELLVVAAGNEPIDIGVGANRRWPASLNGGVVDPFGQVMMVVGAYGPDLRPTAFTSYGDPVDILAPGCRIMVRNMDGTTSTVFGTSFAAPFVTFTAAMLHAAGLGAGEIKRRIVMSGDWDDHLKYVVRSKARLNVARALQVFDDVVVGRDGQDYPPNKVWPDRTDLPVCEGETIKRVDLARIDVADQEALTLTISENRPDGTWNPPRLCKAVGEGFTLQGRTDTVPWRSVSAIVFASRNAAADPVAVR